jgi:hypothetical protein
MRQLAREYKTSEATMRRIIKNDLRLFPYRIRKAHVLTPSMKKERLKNARNLLKWAEGRSFSQVIFSDEKLFDIEKAHNAQNTRQLLPKGGCSTSQAAFVSRSAFPKSVMVWAGICSTGKTPLVFLDKGVKINKEVYVEKIIKGSLLPWATSHFNGQPWTFQQDWAPAHGAKYTKDTLRKLKVDTWGRGYWPSNSPDLNPLDFSIWSVLEQRVSATTHTSVESLKTALMRAWDKITMEELAACVENFEKRLRACIRAGGGYFEHSL